MTPKVTCLILIILIGLVLLINALHTPLSAYKPVSISGTPYMHFSIDDTDLSRFRKYDETSIFTDSIFALLKKWHDDYGAVCSVFVQGDFCIGHKYARELISNSDWLKFSYHGRGSKRTDIEAIRFFRQLNQNIGDNKVIDLMPRLDYFHGNKLVCLSLKKIYGIKGFLTADDWGYNATNRQSNYYLPSEISICCSTKGFEWPLY